MNSVSFVLAHPRECPRALGWWLLIRRDQEERFERHMDQVIRRVFKRYIDDPHDTLAKRVLQHGTLLASLTRLRLGDEVMVNCRGGMCSPSGMKIVAVTTDENPVWPQHREDAKAAREIKITRWRNGGHYYVTADGIEFLPKFDSWEAAQEAALVAFPNAKIIS